MKFVQRTLKPQDAVLLLKIIALDTDEWQQIPMAHALSMSQSEVSQSVARSIYAGLLNEDSKSVNRFALFDFIIHGLKYVFPVHPGPMVRGVVTAHSAAPLNEYITESTNYVWPYSKGNSRGLAITSLFPTVPEAALRDSKLHALLALTDAVRLGTSRERNLAIDLLKQLILEKHTN